MPLLSSLQVFEITRDPPCRDRSTREQRRDPESGSPSVLLPGPVPAEDPGHSEPLLDQQPALAELRLQPVQTMPPFMAWNSLSPSLIGTSRVKAYVRPGSRGCLATGPSLPTKGMNRPTRDA